MKAIITRTNESTGPRIYVLGTGMTEQAARIAAQAWANGGLNADDHPYMGGQVAEIDPEWAALAEAGYAMGVIEREPGRLSVDWDSYFQSRDIRETADQQRQRRMLLGELPVLSFDMTVRAAFSPGAFVEYLIDSDSTKTQAGRCYPVTKAAAEKIHACGGTQVLTVRLGDEEVVVTVDEARSIGLKEVEFETYRPR